MPSSVRRVLVAGGTHGNEWLGAWLVQKWQRDPRPLQRQGFDTVALLANPPAFARGVRYLDQDLNRCFDDPRANPDAAWEIRRAREILDDFGPGGRMPVDVVLDMHLDVAAPLTVDGPVIVSGQPALHQVYAFLAR